MRKIFIFYFTKEYTFIYIKNSKKEIIDKVNNTFMKYSEIIDYNRFMKFKEDLFLTKGNNNKVYKNLKKFVNYIRME